jgi:hypothetical protein
MDINKNDILDYIGIQHQIYSENCWPAVEGQNIRSNMNYSYNLISDGNPDRVEIYTPKREYKMVISKRHKLYAQSEFGKYVCTIDFVDNIGRTVISIPCTEKDLLKAAEEMNMFIDGYGSIYESIVYFGYNNINIWFLFLGYIDCVPSEEPIPSDTDDSVSLSFYSSDSVSNNKLRLYFDANVAFLEDFIYAIYQVLANIPYIDKVIESTIFDMYETINRISENYRW